MLSVLKLDKDTFRSSKSERRLNGTGQKVNEKAKRNDFFKNRDFFGQESKSLELSYNFSTKKED